MKKNLIVVLTLLLGCLSFAQKANIYESANYTINVPDGWRSTNDNDIVNIFPSNEIGAITISEYHDLNIPKEETKKFILALYKSTEEESKIKSNKGKKGYTEYSYEYVDEHDKLVWTTKVFQKDKNLFLISINCGQKYWNGNYMSLFKEAFNSFKIK